MNAKTTLYLPESLHRRAKIRASEAGITLTEFFQRSVESALERRAGSRRGAAAPFDPPSKKLGRLKADVTSRRSLMDRLD